MNEPIQDGLGDALRRLREDAASQTAPHALEGKMLEAFRAHHVASRAQRRRMWIPAAIAAALILAVVSRLSDPVRVESPAVPISAAPIVRPPTIESATLSPPAVQKPRPARKRRSSARKPGMSVASSRPAPEQQEFIEIPYAPPLTPYDEGHVVRVNMAGASARRMGVPVMMDRVQADLVVGNDGLPRAIRVVSNSGTQFH